MSSLYRMVQKVFRYVELDVNHECNRRTDGQTDGQTDGRQIALSNSALTETYVRNVNKNKDDKIVN